MRQYAWQAIFGGLAITTALGTMPVAADGILPLAADTFPERNLRVEIAQIVPITVVPYRWTARKKSGGSIVLSGYQPDSEIKASLLALAGAQALDASSIADGAPEGFASNAETALALLALLENGTADLTGSVWTVTGRVDTLDAAQQAQALIDGEGLGDKGWTLDLTLPQPDAVADNDTDEDGAAGDMALTDEPGSDTTIEKLPSDTGSDTSSVEELDTVPTASDAAAAAKSVDDDEKIASAADAETVAEVAEQSAPPAAPMFSFAAMKQGDKWLLGGDAPIEAFQRLVDIHLGITSSGRLAIVPAPEGFGAEALSALDLLATLESGRVLFDGESWTLNGVAISEGAAEVAEKQLLEQGIAGAISVAFSEETLVSESSPEQDMPAEEASPELSVSSEPVEETPVLPDEEVPALPVAEPYIWQADLDENGQIDFSGYVPDGNVGAYLDNQTGGGSNLTSPADGAPDGFSGDVLAGIDALKALTSGQVGFDGTNWRFVGVAGDAAAANLARAALGARADTWTVSIDEPVADMALEAPTEVESDLATNELGESEVAADMAVAPDMQQDMSEEEASPPAKADFSELGLSTEPTHSRTEPPPLPEVAPFIWTADLQPDGTTDFSGYVPAETLKRYLDVRGSGGRNDTQPAAGAPEGFVRDVLAGLDALSELDSGRLDFDGATWSLTGAAVDEAAKSRALSSLGSFADSWAVAIATPEPPPPPPVRPEPVPVPVIDRGAPDYVFTAEKTSEGGIELSGDVPAAATRSYLGVIAATAAADNLTVRPGAPGDFVDNAVGGLRALMALDSGKLVYKDFGWSFVGKSASETTRAAVAAAITALPSGETWSVDIVPPTPLEICAAEVIAFDKRNAILFNAGSSRITEASLPAIDEIAQTLKTCPSAVIHVEGHTDSDGDAESNLILSVSRAEAVVDQLITLGVGEGRIYAIGYGESLPIASNDTNDGKRRNRRIVITVSDGPG